MLHRDLGKALESYGDLPGAIAAVEAAIAVDPDDSQSYAAGFGQRVDQRPLLANRRDPGGPRH